MRPQPAPLAPNSPSLRPHRDRRAPIWLAALGVLAMACASPPEEPEPAAQPTDRVHDPLSMPLTPTVKVSDFKSAETCAACHKEHHRQWSLSRHAFAMKDPVFKALVGLRQKARGGREDAFCVQCHSPIGTRGGEVVPGFSFDALSPVVQEGVTCEACHKAAEVVRTHNAGLRLDPTGPVRGPFDDPEMSLVHDSQPSPMLETSAFCGSCHDLVELSGLPLERPFAEWQSSPAAAAGQNCQSCHMPLSQGPVVDGGPARARHSHLFVGIEPPLGGGVVLGEGERAEVDGAIAKLLDGAAGLAIEATGAVTAGEQLDLHLTVDNHIAGHNLPTGSTFVRQLWIHLRVTDAAGATVYQTGDLDAQGDLRDHWSSLDPYGDIDLVTLSARMTDAAGQPTVLPWLAAELHSGAIAPLHSKTFTFFVPVPAATAGPLHVEASLKLRAYPPFLLRLLGLDALLPSVPLHVLAGATQTVVVR